MKRTTILFIITFLLFDLFAKSQIIQKYDSISDIQKAIYLKEDLTKFLQKNVKYPFEALTNNIQGDVILSIVITKNGEVDSLTVLSSPNNIISTSSLIAFKKLNNEWSPSIINDRPIDKKYLIVFRYRMYLDTKPSNYKSQADNYFKKQKYNKALKFFNKAIKDNQYDSELFESRSKVRKILGDIEGEKQDFSTSTILKNEIMTTINIVAIGKTRRTEEKTTIGSHITPI